MPSISRLFRYPIKGLTCEPLRSAALAPGAGIALDRIYAIAHGATPFDPDAPVYMQKTQFLTLMTHPRLAQLRLSFNEAGHEVRIERAGAEPFTAALAEEAGREALAAYLDEFIGEEAKGAPRVVCAKGHVFFDIRDRCLSVLNLASIAALGEEAGLTLDPLRFRANVYIDGLDPWAERGWAKGATFQLGEVEMRVLKPISRCAAINVDLETGTVDRDLPPILRERFERNFMGVYAEVIGSGTIAPGATLQAPAPDEGSA